MSLQMRWKLNGSCFVPRLSVGKSHKQVMRECEGGDGRGRWVGAAEFVV